MQPASSLAHVAGRRGSPPEVGPMADTKLAARKVGVDTASEAHKFRVCSWYVLTYNNGKVGVDTASQALRSTCTRSAFGYSFCVCNIHKSIQHRKQPKDIRT